MRAAGPVNAPEAALHERRNHGAVTGSAAVTGRRYSRKETAHSLAAVLGLLLVSAFPLCAGTNGVQPLLLQPDPSKAWVLSEHFSDEFNTTNVNTARWEKDMRPWGDRAWSSDNVYQTNGSLFIRATYDPHRQGRREFFYKLGILRSREKITYGFFEARIKGCSRFPGLCPAFWLYSSGKAPDDLNPNYPEVTYSEIDIVEMLQGQYDPILKRKVGVEHIDLNLHTRILDEHGKEVWRRPNDLPEVCRHIWTAPWDPRDNYHVYACENTPEKITWFIDGQKVAEEENLYWHLPMSVTLTMELRPPFIAWAGVDGRVPVPEATTAEGFPTEMAVDYVRCWVREGNGSTQDAGLPVQPTGLKVGHP